MANTFQQIGAVAVNLPIFQRNPRIAHALARNLARKIVERELQAKGFLIPHVPPIVINVEARAYLAAHPELLEQAAEIVRTHPRFRKMAEVEERKRERQERKFRKQTGLDLPVCGSDHGKTGTDNARELVQLKGD